MTGDGVTGDGVTGDGVTGGGTPLARLLAIGYRSLIDGLHRELRERGWDDVRPAFGFVLLAVRDGPKTMTALTADLGTSKQATSKLVGLMEAAGYVTRTNEAADGRQRPIRLTRRGGRLLAEVEDIYRDLEAAWAGVLGARSVDRLRRDLEQVLTDLHCGALPPVRPV